MTCTFYNELDDDPTGDLRIVKETDPDVTGATFGFESDELGDFLLEDNESAMFEDLDVEETYEITEILTGDWDLDDASCDRGDFSLSGNTLEVEIVAGELTTCTFYNVREENGVPHSEPDPEPARLTIVKETSGHGPDFPFEFHSDLGPFFLLDGESEAFSDLDAGTYDIWEYVPLGWTLEWVRCDSDDWEAIEDGVSVWLAQGESVTCTFRNQFDPEPPESRNPGLRLEKATNVHDADSPTGPILAEGDLVTWTFVVTNTGDVTLHDVAIIDDNGTLDDGDDIVVASGLTIEAGESITAVLTGTAELGQFRNDSWAFSECDGPITDAGDTGRCWGPDDHDPSHYLVPHAPNGLPNGGSGGIAGLFEPGAPQMAGLSLLAAGLLFIVGTRLQGLGRRTH